MLAYDLMLAYDDAYLVRLGNGDDCKSHEVSIYKKKIRTLFFRVVFKFNKIIAFH